MLLKNYDCFKDFRAANHMAPIIQKNPTISILVKDTFKNKNAIIALKIGSTVTKRLAFTFPRICTPIQ